MFGRERRLMIEILKCIPSVRTTELFAGLFLNACVRIAGTRKSSIRFWDSMALKDFCYEIRRSMTSNDVQHGIERINTGNRTGAIYGGRMRTLLLPSKSNERERQSAACLFRNRNKCPFRDCMEWLCIPTLIME